MCVDTPWDEPSGRSYEFRRYVKEEMFGDAPWDRLDENVLCKSSSSMSFMLLCNDHIAALLKGMLHLDPSERMCVQDIMAHPWCSRYVRERTPR